MAPHFRWAVRTIRFLLSVCGRPVAVVLIVCPGAADALNPDWSLGEYVHEAWTLGDGTIPARPFAIAQGKDGFIWVGTGNGLLRFDGVRFLPWPAEGSEALPSRQIFSLLGARDGSLWVGTERGLSHLEHGRVTNLLEADEADVTHISADRQDGLWLWHSGSRAQQPLCRVDNNKPACFGPEASIQPQTTFSILADDNGHVWLGTSTSLLEWKQGQLETYPLHGLEANANAEGVAALAADADGAILVGVARNGPGLGLERFRNGVFTTVTAPGFDGSKLDVLSLMVDRNQALWVGTSNNGIYRVYRDRAEHFATADGLSGVSVRRLFQDSEGTVWAVTEKGIDHFRDRPVVSIARRADFYSTEVDSVLATRDGSLWVGGWQTLYVLRQGAATFAPAAQTLSEKQITTVFEDGAGQLWVGIGDSLNTLRDGHFESVHMDDGGRVGMIVSMTQDRQGQLWAVALGPPRRRVLRIDPALHSASEVKGLPASSKVTGDPDSGIWLGLLTGELARYRDERLEVLHPAHEGPTSRIKQLVTESDGSVMASTGFGLLAWRAGSTAVMSTRNGLPCTQLFASIVDAGGNLWLYMQCGLVRIDAAELRKWWRDPAARLEVRTWDAADGAQGALAPFPGAARTPDGRLWFANNSVLQMIDPRLANRAPTAPPVYVEAFTADRRSYSIHGDATTPPLTHDIQIDYTAPSFVAPRKVRFRYKLEGFDRDWNDAGLRRQAFYTNLPPNRYTFHVKALNEGGVWSETAAELRFTVQAAFYQTLAFKLASVAILCGAVWLGYLARMRHVQETLRGRMEARSAERERIARDLHDTLLQGIQALMFRLQTWAVDPEIPPRQQNEIEAVASQTVNIVIEARERIIQVRHASPRPGELAEALAAAGHAHGGNPQPQFEVRFTGQPRYLTPEAQEQLAGIGTEAINNALQHSGASSITATVHYHRRWLRLTVSDNGRGFRGGPEEVEENHFGLVGMRERAALINAALIIDTREGAGTTVRVTAPAQSVYL
jgi:signal transduction histidine kinase/ligand-binding sensor domain-containing protein